MRAATDYTAQKKAVRNNREKADFGQNQDNPADNPSF
jgi:hypothetical protein